MIQSFRKKPVEVTAIHYDGANHAEIIEWLATFGVTATHTPRGLIIHTLEGPLGASPGDHVIRGSVDEAWACKPIPFANTYESVDNPKENQS